MSKHEPLKGVVLDEQVTLSIEEVCEMCGIRKSVVIEMVAEGIAEPLEETETRFVFSGVAVTRLLTAHRLQRDLQVNLAGAALALELLDEIDALKRGRRS